MGNCVEKWRTSIQERDALQKQRDIKEVIRILDDKFRSFNTEKQQTEREMTDLENQIQETRKNKGNKPRQILAGDLTLLVAQKQTKTRLHRQIIAQMNVTQLHRSTFETQQQQLGRLKQDEQIAKTAKSLQMNLTAFENKADQQQEMLEELEEMAQNATDEMQGIAEQHLLELGVQEEVEQLLSSSNCKPVETAIQPKTKFVKQEKKTTVSKEKQTTNYTRVLME